MYKVDYESCKIKRAAFSTNYDKALKMAQELRKLPHISNVSDPVKVKDDDGKKD